MIASPVETGYGCLMILTSVPVYFVFIAWKDKPKWFQRGMGKSYFIFKKYSHIVNSANLQLLTTNPTKISVLTIFRWNNTNNPKSHGGCSSEKGFNLFVFEFCLLSLFLIFNITVIFFVMCKGTKTNLIKDTF